MFFKKRSLLKSSSYRISFYYREKNIRKILRITLLCFLISPTVVYFIWSFLFFPVQMKGGEMQPTIKEDQWVFFSRSAYGTKKILSHDVPRNRFSEPNIQRGDIIALLPPEVEKKNIFLKILDYPVYALTFGFLKLNKRQVIISRVLGLPGEQIFIENKNIYINGERYKVPWKTMMRDNRLYDEEIIARDNFSRVFIPGGYVFLLNDNWDILSDSRSFSLVPIYRIEGKLIDF